MRTNDAALRVVILGGGFGGLYAARALRRAPARVILVDRRNHHVFQPLLYQVATAALSPGDIAVPIRRILRRQANAEVILGEAISIDVPARRVILRDGKVPYDYLIVATGATHSYFGRDEWAPFAPGLKTIEDALEIRRRILLAFEAAERETDPERRAAWLTFVIVGAGPTGVELAGAVAEIARRILREDFRRIDPRAARVFLVEAGPRVLPSFDPDLAQKTERSLRGLGVEVLTGGPVTAIDATGASIGERRIPARIVLWAAGVAASPLARSLGTPLDRAGRVPVAPDLTLPGHPEVFVIGDLAALRQDGRPVPGVAPAAKQMGQQTACNILRALRGLPYRPFHYRDAGSLATIGRAAAVADFGRIRLWGLPAWLAWLVIHIYFLIGFRNRLLVILQWAWLYLRHESGARLITGDVDPLLHRDAAGRPPS
ncbi:MAG TPA: NAD(P)/FAD-dependent oxidoreductase [Candidatus Polarisedimenticolia bacterium]|nr:NAD(P)/FAD-dependent oxidoreductase [Candidatus Polarisedimenticolia bacterium]